MVIRKPVNVDAMKSILSKVRQLTSSLEIQECGGRIFIFQFGSMKEKEKVLFRQPWSFNKVLIMLKEFAMFDDPNEIDFSSVRFESNSMVF
ncbi:hypothetical protein PTKIN_Ptkin03bG0097700 [Pterospermum kingtungense]